MTITNINSRNKGIKENKATHKI